MTAINIIKETHAVHLFSDTQVSIEGMGGIAQTSKCAAFPHLQAAIATRGNFGVLDIVSRVACWCAGSLGSLRKSLGWQLKNAGRGLPVTGQSFTVGDVKNLQSPFEVFVIGWDDDGPHAFMLFSHGLQGFPAWEVIDIPYVVTTPLIGPSLLKKLERTTNLIGLIPDIIAAQVSAEPTIIGGSIQQTTVTATGISTKIIGRIPQA